MSYEIPPVEGAIYRGKSGSFRRVVKIHNRRRSCGTWVYDVEWAPAKDARDFHGNPRKLKAWCSTWESWVKERAQATAAQGHTTGHSGDGSPAGDKPGA